MTLWAGRFATTFLPPYKVKENKEMGKINTEVVQLRKKALSKKEYLSRIQQLSWRIKKVEDLYSIDSENTQELDLLISEYDDIYAEFLYLAQLEIGSGNYVPYSFEKKGGQDE
jgi:hypothetical protein